MLVEIKKKKKDLHTKIILQKYFRKKKYDLKKGANFKRKKKKN